MGGTGLRFHPDGLCLMALNDEKRQRGSSSNRSGQASQIRRAVTTARLRSRLAGLRFIRRRDESADGSCVQDI